MLTAFVEFPLHSERPWSSDKPCSRHFSTMYDPAKSPRRACIILA